ncbi:MAG: ribbon-helix-helix domain-containing protein [Planctomycetaceae bacterium]|jgi:hypothetical protein|nr:ribbon-helix-helix domain-containing protein [Planctomycetaceae bacterium]
MVSKNKKQWGGSRPNSGRKLLGPEAKKTMSMVIQPTLLDKIDLLARQYGQSRSVVIEHLLESALSADPK